MCVVTCVFVLSKMFVLCVFVLSKSVVVTSGCCVAEMYKLMVACLCVMVGNTEAERVFSCQNRVKTKQRTCLTVEHLDPLMRVSHCGVGVEEFDYDSALAQFVKVKRRIDL